MSFMNIGAKFKIKFCIVLQQYIKKVIYIMTKWSLSEGCKIGCMFKNQQYDSPYYQTKKRKSV